MWTRTQIKTNAKKALSKNFIYSVVVYIGYLILSLQIIQIYINARDTFASFSEFSILQETYSIPFIPFSVSAEWILHCRNAFSAGLVRIHAVSYLYRISIKNRLTALFHHQSS